MRQPADHVWTDDEGDRERGQRGEDRAQRQVAEDVEAGIELRGPLGEVAEHQCAPPWFVVPCGAERGRDPLQPIDSRSLDEDGHALVAARVRRPRPARLRRRTSSRPGRRTPPHAASPAPPRAGVQRRSRARTRRSRRAAARTAAPSSAISPSTSQCSPGIAASELQAGAHRAGVRVVGVVDEPRASERGLQLQASRDRLHGAQALLDVVESRAGRMRGRGRCERVHHVVLAGQVEHDLSLAERAFELELGDEPILQPAATSASVARKSAGSRIPKVICRPAPRASPRHRSA